MSFFYITFLQMGSVALSALIVLNICYNGFSAENVMLAAVFIGDAIAGLTLLKRSINQEIFSVIVDNASLLKPSYAEDFKFIHSHFEQV